MWDNNYITDIFNKFIFSNIEIKREEMIPVLKNLINDDKYINIPVDMYYIPNRIDYKLHHQKHNVLLTGYDEEKECFFALLDIYLGYGEIEIPFTIISRETDELIGVELINIKDDLKNYIFDIKSVINNAQKLRQNLSKLSYQTPWINGGSSQGDIANVFITMTKYVERQKANIELILYIEKSSILSKQGSQQLITQIEGIKCKWEQIKNLFIKSFINKNLPNYEKLNLLALKCFELEGYMWHDFITLVKQ
jgi:hypothetical protein